MKRQTIWKMRLLTALLAVFVLAPVWAQNSGRIISGKVVDESGEPLAGAVVMINGDSSSAVGRTLTESSALRLHPERMCLLSV